MRLVQPVETGHELILATLLLHFGVDDIAQLPSAWQPVVRDVYDIASSLAEAKVAYQWELTKLRAELERIRPETASRPSASGLSTERVRQAASASSTSLAPNVPKRKDNPDAKSPIETSTNTRGDCNAAAKTCNRIKIVAQSLPQSAPRWNASTKVGSNKMMPSQPLRMHLPSKQKGDTGSFGRSAYCQWLTAPARLSARKAAKNAVNLPVPLPNKQYIHVRPGQHMASEAPGSDVNGKVLDTETVCDHGQEVAIDPIEGALVLQQSVPRTCSTMTKLLIDLSPYKCIAQQLICERRLQNLQRTISQTSQWDLNFSEGELIVIVTCEAVTRCHSVRDIRAALASVCDEVETVRHDLVTALKFIGGGWKDRAWLLSRHAKLLEMMNEIEEWVDAIASLVNRFSSIALARSSGDDLSSPTHLWRNFDDYRFYGKNGISLHEMENLRRHQLMPKSWKHLTPVFVEFAVSSLLMRGLEIYVAALIQPPTHESLSNIGEAARELQRLVDKFQVAKRKCANDHPMVVKWQDTILSRHAKTLETIQRRATTCSESLCRVPKRLRFSVDVPTTCTTTTRLARFPSSWFSWDVYEELVLAIVSSHVTFTRLREAMPCHRAAAKTAIISRLRMVKGVAAPWADSRFTELTDSRYFEKCEYIKLMNWCDVLTEIILEA